MDRIKNWALLMVFLSAGSLIYCFLLPEGGISKTVKSVVSLVSLSLVCLPLFGIKDFFSRPVFPDTEQVSMNSYADYIKEAAEGKINLIIDNTVKKFTDVPYKTEISIDIREDNSINIEYVSVIFSVRPTGYGEIKKALAEVLGIVPDIKAGEVSD